MKIIIFGSFLGSIIAFRGRLIDNLVSHGHDVHIVAPDSQSHQLICQELRAKGVTLHHLVIRRNSITPIADLAMLVRLLRIFCSLRADIILAYNLKPIIYGLVAARFAKVKVRAALITGLGFSFVSRDTPRGRLLNRSVMLMYKVALSCATAVVFQNDEDAELFSEKKLVLPKIKTFVVGGSGIDLDDYSTEPIPETPTFLMACRLIKSKGVREYVEAARLSRAKFPSARFLLAGWIDEGPDAIAEADLNEWIESGVIEFLGELVDIKLGISRSSICVLPSYREGTSRFILEAMAMGRAIITSDAPGCRHTVKQGISGFLVEPRSSESLAAAMGKLITDQDLIKSMSRASRNLAKERFDVRHVNTVMSAAMDISPHMTT